jgi:hypothetical protein
MSALGFDEQVLLPHSHPAGDMVLITRHPDKLHSVRNIFFVLFFLTRSLGPEFVEKISCFLKMR